MLFGTMSWSMNALTWTVNVVPGSVSDAGPAGPRPNVLRACCAKVSMCDCSVSDISPSSIDISSDYRNEMKHSYVSARKRQITQPILSIEESPPSRSAHAFLAASQQVVGPQPQLR